jgi:rod shape-determining protein MreD
MINTVLKYSLLFILLILLQVLLFNNIQFSGYVNPYVYILFILLLPMDIQAWLILPLAFVMGLLIDFFSGSPGVHTSATVLAAFSRPYVFRLVSPSDGYESDPHPSMFTYGFRWFLSYSLLIVLIHHTALFYLEVFRFSGFFRTLLRVLISTVFSLTFILLIEYYRKRK